MKQDSECMELAGKEGFPMKNRTESGKGWIALIGSAALGAAAMYLYGSQRDAQRPEGKGDKKNMKNKAAHAADSAVRDVGQRWQGLRARLGRMLQAGQRMDDVALEERVRAAARHCLADPSALAVNAAQGCVTLDGQVPESERLKLLANVGTLQGVSRIDDRLERSGAEPAADGPREGDGQAHDVAEEAQWVPAVRTATALGAGTLGAYGVMRRSPGSIAMAVILGILARNAADQSVKAGNDDARPDTLVVEADEDIHAAPQTVFELWSRCENFPFFLPQLEQVRDLGEGRSHWMIKGADGTRLEWQAMLTECQAPTILGWKSEPGSPLEHAGLVRFEPNGGITHVVLKMAYACPPGEPQHRLAAILGYEPQVRLREAMVHMKAFIEKSLAPPSTASSPARDLLR